MPSVASVELEIKVAPREQAEAAAVAYVGLLNQEVVDDVYARGALKVGIAVVDTVSHRAIKKAEYMPPSALDFVTLQTERAMAELELTAGDVITAREQHAAIVRPIALVSQPAAVAMLGAHPGTKLGSKSDDKTKGLKSAVTLEYIDWVHNGNEINVASARRLTLRNVKRATTSSSGTSIGISWFDRGWVA